MVGRSWMHSFQLKRQNAEWRIPTLSLKNIKILHSAVRGLWSHACHVLQPKQTLLDHPMPLGTMVNGQYYCALLQEKERRVLCRKRELRENGVILLQENATPHRHSDVQYLVQHWGWEVLAHPTFQISPHVITGCLHMWKIPSSRKTFESEDGINTAVTATLHWARMNTELQLIVYHVGGKSVWTVLVITLRRGRMCTHSGMLVVLLSCILLFQ